MMNKVKNKINKDIITIGIIIIISIILYGKYISTPFGNYDTWFERIVYGGYNFKELPQPLQKLEIPTGFKEYREYREKIVGRLFGSVLPTYLMMKIFGDWVLGWRIVLYFVIFISFWLIYLILKKLQLSYWYRFYCLLFFVVLLSRYFYKPISIIIGISHLFFLIAIILEFNNSGLKKFRITNSILGSLFIFLSMFIRELSATSVPAFMAILLFWHNEKGNVVIKFKWFWRRLLPYIFFATLYIGLYLRMYVNKVDFAYSNMISFHIDFSYFERVFFLLFKWVGLNSSLYLGVFILIISGLIFLLTLLKSRYLPDKIGLFKLGFGISLLVPTLFLIPFLTHGTGSFTLQYLGVMIICLFLISYIDHSKINSFYKKSIHISLIIIFSSLFVIYALEARQKAENFCADSCVTQNAVEWIVNRVPKNSVVSLDGFSLTAAFSFVSDVYIAGMDNSIRYRMKSSVSDQNEGKYIKYLREAFVDNKKTKKATFITIKKEKILEEFKNRKKNIEIKEKEFIRFLKKYSLGYLLIKGSGTANDYFGRSGFINNFLAKFFYGVRVSTLKKQLLKGIEYKIELSDYKLELSNE